VHLDFEEPSAVTTAVPMLADFSIRLAFGLTSTLLLLPWKTVPLRFFRIELQVVLAVLVLAALDQARAAGPSVAVWTVVAGALLAYFASVAWGLGLPSLGVGISALTVVATVFWLVAASHAGPSALWTINGASRAASGFLMGSTLTAMLLGHQYLTAPSMTIDPLKRVLVVMACALLVRALLAGAGTWATPVVDLSPAFPSGAPNLGTILAVRWGVGFVAFGVATLMTWRTASIRSTQSATGILYIAMIFVLFGELTSLVVAEPARVIP
jgi:hypothetical protein